MAEQVFSDAELQVLQKAAKTMSDNLQFVGQRMNMTKAEQKAADVAAIDAEIASVQSAIDGLDAVFAAQKASRLAQLNGTMSVLAGLKTKLQNVPE